MSWLYFNISIYYILSNSMSSSKTRRIRYNCKKWCNFFCKEWCNLTDFTSCNPVGSTKRIDDSPWSNSISRKKLVLSLRGRVSCQLSNPDFLHNTSGKKVQQEAEFASAFACSLDPKFATNFCFSYSNLSKSICKDQIYSPNKCEKNSKAVTVEKLEDKPDASPPTDEQQG